MIEKRTLLYIFMKISLQSMTHPFVKQEVSGIHLLLLLIL